MSVPLLLVAHAASTWMLTGLIWTIQLVHYPLFALADRGQYAAFATDHGRRITLLVGPAMTVELALAVWLVVRRPAGVPGAWAWAGLALVAVIWLSTALLQVPEHARLASGFDADAHARLVSGNWIRTAAWTLRAVLAAAMLLHLPRPE